MLGAPIDHRYKVQQNGGRFVFECSCGVDGSSGAVDRERFEELVQRLHPALSA